MYNITAIIPSGRFIHYFLYSSTDNLAYANILIVDYSINEKVKRPRSPKPRLEAATRPEDGAKGGGAALSRRRRPLKPQRQERRDVREASVAS